MTGDWLVRYRAGERGQVWDELAQLGDAVRDPDALEEVQLVCDEMARRARHNVEVIVQRLIRDGYRFHANDDEQTPVIPHIPPTPAAVEYAAWLQERFGPVPLTLLSWVRIVGDVWLVGTHPDWPLSASADPLVIQVEGSHYPHSSMRFHYEYEWEQWRDRSADDPNARPFQLTLAPDRYHKDNVSGGGPYGMAVPDAHADGLFVAETTMPFVQYLNWVFLRGGFPFLTGSSDALQIPDALAEDLLPL
ncbi:hypothetical protein [Micromonospora sp. NPDC006431]|uniref:hypothetical protein n=1 Tax=Micromonospora sp. NPDC006431 TaxID=3364235 RepID=UPI00368F774F